MKPYAWQPSGYGELSFFVVAETESDAIAYVEADISIRKSLPIGDINRIIDYEYRGWGSDYYTLTTSDVGVVLLNEND